MYHNKVIIIAGMHRSGTTLTARWLQACGLNIGENLLISKYDHANPQGLHYEDLDFLMLHKRILKSLHLDTDGMITDEPVSLSLNQKSKAHAILQVRQGLQQWGWKEPRTCLFLDFWMKQIPSAKILVVFRSYEQVADSILRRKLNHEKLLRRIFYRLTLRPITHYARHYIRVWTRYNQDILTAIQHDPENIIVLKTRDVVEYGNNIIQLIKHKWHFDLTPINTDEIFDNSRLHSDTSYVDIDDPQLADAVSDAQQVYDTLSEWRKWSLETLVNEIGDNG